MIVVLSSMSLVLCLGGSSGEILGGGGGGGVSLCVSPPRRVLCVSYLTECISVHYIQTYDIR